jgi:hypothetical protein
MIKNKVYKLTKDVEVGRDMPLSKNQEIEIVQDVVYINGYPVPPAMQPLFLNFVINNQDKMVDVTREW